MLRNIFLSLLLILLVFLPKPSSAAICANNSTSQGILYCTGFILIGLTHIGLSYVTPYVTSKYDDKVSGDYTMHTLPAWIVTGTLSGAAGLGALYADGPGLYRPNWGRFTWVYPSSLIVAGILGYYTTRKLKGLSIGMLPDTLDSNSKEFTGVKVLAAVSQQF